MTRLCYRGLTEEEVGIHMSGGNGEEGRTCSFSLGCVGLSLLLWFLALLRR